MFSVNHKQCDLMGLPECIPCTSHAEDMPSQSFEVLCLVTANRLVDHKSYPGRESLGIFG